MALISFAIFVTSGASPFFAQPRVGRRGRPFPCLKFRTMVRDAGERLAGLLEDPARREEWERYRKFRNDPRVTWLGRILRSTSLDELPQLFNVVAGHMSLVGPRPYLVEELGRLGPDADMILSIRPGMTGLWQVSGRRERTFEERLELEAWYVMNWSLWLDLVILLRTVPAVLFRRGAH
jgi:undecaprenyl-phosphate galactose phosphotransferase